MLAPHIGAGDRVGAGVRDDEQRVVVLRRLGHRQRDARVHRADEDVDVVALDQLVDVVGRLRRLRLVVDLEVLDLAPAELAALLLDVELEAVLDRVAERGVGAAVGQHEADLDRAGRALRQRRRGEKERSGAEAPEAIRRGLAWNGSCGQFLGGRAARTASRCRRARRRRVPSRPRRQAGFRQWARRAAHGRACRSRKSERDRRLFDRRARAFDRPVGRGPATFAFEAGSQRPRHDNGDSHDPRHFPSGRSARAPGACCSRSSPHRRCRSACGGGDDAPAPAPAPRPGRADAATTR